MSEIFTSSLLSLWFIWLKKETGKKKRPFFSFWSCTNWIFEEALRVFYGQNESWFINETSCTYTRSCVYKGYNEKVTEKERKKILLLCRYRRVVGILPIVPGITTFICVISIPCVVIFQHWNGSLEIKYHQTLEK